DLREWMAPSNPRALASMLLAATGTLAVFLLAMRSRRELRGCRNPAPAIWLLWGLLWVLVIALPFAALAGRNPENRYTTIPSFGYGVAIAAGAAWLAGPLGRRSPTARVRQTLVIGGVTALFTFYAFVNTSDVGEWERASRHARAVVTQTAALAPGLPLGAGVAQVGVPPNVGGAYVFTTGESYRAAVHLLYGDVEPVVSSDLWMRDVIAASHAAGGAPAPLVGFGYDSHAHEVALLDSVWVCGASCVGAPLLQPAGATTDSRWIYAQRYDEAAPDLGGLGLLFAAGEDGAAASLRSCWAFFDTTQVVVDPATFDEETLQRSCAEAADTLLSSGALRLLAPAPAE
ncbi:MAG: hypothetical protein ACRC1H_11980, partial [Caldilineaceae bacterium]